MDFSDAQCNDGIMLEPRLMEYLNKKKVYNDNDIDSSVSLERMYSISKDDKHRIKKYLRGKRDLYTRTKLNNDSNFIDPSETEFNTLENEFKNDPRYDRLQKKMQRQRDAQKHRHNYGNMRDNYDMYNQQTPYDFMDDSLRSHRESRYGRSRQVNQYADDSYMLDSNDEELLYDNPNYIFHPERRSNMTYHNTPKISYNNRLINTQIGSGRSSSVPYSHSVNEIIGDIDSYREHVGNSYSHTSDMDFNNKMVIPKMNSNKKRGHTNKYMSVPQMHSNGLRDIDMDNYVRYGVNSRATKGVGYENPVEHYYQYIDPDIQHPNHVVNDRGLPSRLYNKSRAKKYKRDIM